MRSELSFQSFIVYNHKFEFICLDKLKALTDISTNIDVADDNTNEIINKENDLNI
jgi:hypothetical protein